MVINKETNVSKYLCLSETKSDRKGICLLFILPALVIQGETSEVLCRQSLIHKGGDSSHKNMIKMNMNI